MSKYSILKINIKGGILSMGDLKTIVETLKEVEVNDISIGERQNIYAQILKKDEPEITEKFRLGFIDFEINNNKYPNIITSYASIDLFSNHPWLEEGTYRDILNAFQFKPELKINISDHTQALTPLYSGQLNFITSTHINFFYLYIQHPVFGDDYIMYPKLVYSTDIAPISHLIEKQILKSKKLNIEELVHNIETNNKLNTINVDEPIKIQKLRFPYYEGMNKVGDNVWLGIFRRKNDYALPLLESIYNLCADLHLGQINLTARRSILIKNIKEEERIEFEKLLSKHGINSRHSALELNWQFADLDNESLLLKNNLVKIFDDMDIRTYGLNFTIDNNKPNHIGGAIIIQKKRGLFKFNRFLKGLTVYNLYFAPSFELNSTEHIPYAKNLSWQELPLNLRNLCEKYYQELSTDPKKTKNILKEEPKQKNKEIIYQCKHCLSIYDEHYGDTEQGIPQNTPFNLLPSQYHCPLCEAPKEDFHLLEPVHILN